MNAVLDEDTSSNAGIALAALCFAVVVSAAAHGLAFFLLEDKPFTAAESAQSAELQFRAAQNRRVRLVRRELPLAEPDKKKSQQQVSLLNEETEKAVEKFASRDEVAKAPPPRFENGQAVLSALPSAATVEAPAPQIAIDPVQIVSLQEDRLDMFVKTFDRQKIVTLPVPGDSEGKSASADGVSFLPGKESGLASQGTNRTKSGMPDGVLSAGAVSAKESAIDSLVSVDTMLGVSDVAGKIDVKQEENLGFSAVKENDNRIAAAASMVAADESKSAPISKEIDKTLIQKEQDLVRSSITSGEHTALTNCLDFAMSSWMEGSGSDAGSKYFRIRIKPSPAAVLQTAPKDVVFLVDVSNSVGKKRLKAICRELKKALRTLDVNDGFNIAAFRETCRYLFPEVSWREVSNETLNAADEWLDNLTAGGNTDVFGTLNSIYYLRRRAKRPMIAVMITDGEATIGRHTASAKIVDEFSKLGRGLASVYMFGVKSNSNQYLIDMLTASNRGASMINNAIMHSNAANGFVEFFNTFSRPVVSDISVMATADSHAEIYPLIPQNLDKNGYIDIFGRCPASQKEVSVNITGLAGSRSCDCFATLRFDAALPGNDDIRTQWADRRIHELIADYSNAPSNDRLQAIERFAGDYGLKIPYLKSLKEALGDK